MSGGGIQSDEGSQNFMPIHRERLGEKISHVPNTRNVLNPKLASLYPVLKPMKAHVAGLRHLGLDGLVGKAHGDLIVAMNRRGRLRVAEVGEDLSLQVRDFSSGKRAPILRFLNGRAHHGDARGVNGDGGVKEGGVVGAPEMVERPGHAASVGPGQERGVGEDVEGHGRGSEDLHAIAVSGDKAKKAVQVCHGRMGGSGLCAGQRTGCSEDTTVDASTIIQEIAYCYLQLLLLGGGGGRGGIGGGALRCRRAVDRRMIDGRRRGRLDAAGPKAVQQGVYIAWVGEREGQGLQGSRSLRRF